MTLSALRRLINYSFIIIVFLTRGRCSRGSLRIKII